MKDRQILTAQRASRRPKWQSVGTARLPAAFGLGMAGLLVLTVLAVSFAQTAAPSGEELYVDRLGCWNCHGTAGRGGEAHSLVKTQLPLRRFIKHLRLPSGSMPPVPAVLASDGELATVYQWLGGIDAVKIPPPIAVDLKGSRVTAGGSTFVETNVELGVVKSETKLGADPERRH
ncbi:MAG: cytochrome c, partial [Acidobacteria bacterium]|nr:cytochrome c [Acidobacteriota bacterium]